jgi:hypothetical protein
MGTRLAVLVPAEDEPGPGQERGFVYSNFASSISVVRIDDESLLKDVKQPSWKRALTTIQLRRAHNVHDDFAAKNALAKLHDLPANSFSLPKIGYDELQAQVTIAAEFSEAMRSAKIVLWLNCGSAQKFVANRLEPAILCTDTKTALFVRAALGDLRACPCCDQPFLPERKDQQYCSIACRERFRKRRFRSKKGGSK